jgi:hypothetical protein
MVLEEGKMKVVIIGGVATGPKAAARLRRLDPKAEITIIEQGKIISYAGCGMPYFVGGDVDNFQGLNTTTAGIVRDSAFFLNVKTGKKRRSILFMGEPGKALSFPMTSLFWRLAENRFPFLLKDRTSITCFAYGSPRTPSP